MRLDELTTKRSFLILEKATITPSNHSRAGGGVRLNIILKVSNFVLWRDTNNLTGNVGKAEEIIFDPKGLGDYGLVIIRDTIISQVGT